MPVIEGHLGPKPGRPLLAELNKKIGVLFKFSGFNDIRVPARAGPKFVIEKIKSPQGCCIRSFDSDSTCKGHVSLTLYADYDSFSYNTRPQCRQFQRYEGRVVRSGDFCRLGYKGRPCWAYREQGQAGVEL